MAAKKKASAKRPVKKAAAKRPAKKSSPAKKSVAKKSATKKSAKRPAKKAAAKRPATKKVSAATKVDAAKIQIPPVPSRTTNSVTSTPAPSATKASSSVSSGTTTKKSSPAPLVLVVLGILVLAVFALSKNSSSDTDTSPSASTSPTASPSASESASSSGTLAAHEAPMSFVAINNGNGGVTLRWKAPSAMEGLTGYAVSVSYNAKDFTEVTTVPADTMKFDIAMASEDGGTQFLLQSVYSDGTKVDAKKFSLKGKYQN